MITAPHSDPNDQESGQSARELYEIGITSLRKHDRVTAGRFLSASLISAHEEGNAMIAEQAEVALTEIEFGARRR